MSQLPNWVWEFQNQMDPSKVYKELSWGDKWHFRFTWDFFSSVPARSWPDPCLAPPPLMTPRLPQPTTTHIRMTIVAPDIFTTSQKQILCCQRRIEIFRVVWIRSVMSLTAQVGSKIGTMYIVYIIKYQVQSTEFACYTMYFIFCSLSYIVFSV